MKDILCYEVVEYSVKVKYNKLIDVDWFEFTFHSEEKALRFIEENEFRFYKYRLEKRLVAIFE